MSKRNKNKHHRRKQESKDQLINPRQYFKKIGANPYFSGDLDKTDKFLRKHLGQDVVDEFWKKYNDDNRFSHLYYCYSNLDLAKMWYGNNISETCQVAKALTRVSVPPKAKILDVGGGPGAIAFWMAHLWNDCEVTVADQFSDTGNEWAKEIDADRVTFVNEKLPGLSNIGDGSYDVVVMSRVLSYVVDMKPPILTPTYSMDQYLSSPVGKQLLCDFGQIVETINRVLTPDGQAVIVDLWRDRYIYLTSMIFEQKGLYINLNLFDPMSISPSYAALILSKTRDSHHIMDRPLGMSTLLNINNGSVGFLGVSAESIRKNFEDATLHLLLEYVNRDTKVQALNEVLEKNGFTLWYRTVTDGQRGAWIYPAIVTPIMIDRLRELEKQILADGKEIVLSKKSLGI